MHSNRFVSLFRIWLLLGLMIFSASPVSALSQEQKNIFDSGIPYFDVEATCTSGSTQSMSSGSSLIDATKVGAFTGTQITPTAIVLHWTVGEYDTPEEFVKILQSNKADDAAGNKYPNGKSVQLTIDKAGAVYQLSETLETKPVQTISDQDWNNKTIGIEIESIVNPPGEAAPYPSLENDLLSNTVQYNKVLEVVKKLMAKYNIQNVMDIAGKKGIVGHYEIETSKSDPGANFMAKVRADLGTVQPTDSSGISANNSVSTGSTSNCTCSGSSNIQGSTNPETAMLFFLSKGLTHEQSAAIVGNLQHESASLDINPTAVNPTSGAYGIAQWLGGRDDNLRNFAAATNRDYATFDVQLEFLWFELTGEPPTTGASPGQEAKNFESFKANSATVAQGAVAWDTYIERSGGDGLIERINKAEAIMIEFGSLAIPSSRGGGCGGTLDASGCPTAPISQSETVTVVGIQVHPCIADEVERIVNLANAQNLNMGGGGFRDRAGQIAARMRNCGTSNYDIYEKPSGECSTPTAIPGTSNHERGTAVDFTCDGSIFTSRSHPCFIFLDENTGLDNLESEPWHWSIDGN